MKRFSLTIAAIIILFSLNSCRKVIGTGPVVSETRVVKDFSAIDFGVPGEMLYIESDENAIEISAQRNIIDIIETYVSGGELKIRVRSDYNIRSSEDIRITVKAPGIHSLAVSGSGFLETLNTFAPVEGRLKVSGSGRIRVPDIDCASLDAHVSGSGAIEVLNGIAPAEELSISGSGNIDVLKVDAEKVTTQTSGSGNIRLHAADDLKVRISGSGDVFYTGNPRVEVTISGSGRLIRL